jgi:adenylylsulfate kinase-like enzyme
MAENIFTDKEQYQGSAEKENLLKQSGLLSWFTGLSGSGKNTLAYSIEVMSSLMRTAILGSASDAAF